MRKRQRVSLEAVTAAMVAQGELDAIAHGRPISHAMIEYAKGPFPGGLRVQQALKSGIEAAQRLSFVPGVGTGTSAAIGAGLALIAEHERHAQKAARR